MKVVIESRGSRFSRKDLQEKLTRALELATELAAEVRADHIRNLAGVLKSHTPLSHISALPAEEIGDWLVRFVDFLDREKGAAPVRLIETGKKGHFVLVGNVPDVPFLIDSLQAYLVRRNLRFQLISHPILAIRRRKEGLSSIEGTEGRGPKESFIIIKLEGIGRDSVFRIEQGAARVLQAVGLAHRDRALMSKMFDSLGQTAEMEAYRDFWRWVRDGNFLPFSYRCLEVGKKGKKAVTVQEVEGSACGLFADPQELTCCRERSLDDFPAAFQARILRQDPLVVEEIDRISPIHRSEPLVYLGFRERNSDGSWREHSFLGLFSRRSVDSLTSDVPALRRRIEKALDSLGIPKGCHDYRKTVEIFNTFPKVELFFMEPEELVETIRSFTLLYRRSAVRIVAARSLAVNGVTLLILMPRSYYSPENLVRLESYLCRYFHTPSASSRIIHMSTKYLSLNVSLQPERDDVRIDLDRLERGLTKLARPWDDKLRILLEGAFGEGEGVALWEQYRQGLPREYRPLVHPRFAVRDVRNLERVRSGEREVYDFWGPLPGPEGYCRIQFYSRRKSYLNEFMPYLENLNLCVIDEVDFTLNVAGEELFIKSFAFRTGTGEDASPARGRDILLDALTALRKGEVENDYLNRLLVLTGLSWREIDIFRGYRNYYFQLGSPFSKRRVAFALINNPEVARLLFRYFEARFRPEPKWESPLDREEKALSPIRQDLASALESVRDINEDQILRTLFNLIDSTVRTNFFLRRNSHDYFFSFKISAIGIIDMPAPRPLFEIYVHSATMEGIHLRGGKVARGGLRWSDRPDDFRTEILGLMKTQMTKNSLIVPVGSKGGFVVKTPFTGREEGAALSKAAYQTLIRGLLDITDNRFGEKIVHPPGVVFYDEEDPYLVVAADKGTAHLSDTANAVSGEYDFWLGDAFASGGSRGYDHKKLGITARGAWESTKAHFREMGRDIQSDPFTVIGIGDMSGDVFGNGMLLSRQIRLLAAFDHRHIFLDPDPDPEASFRERQRLFKLPRSSWDDYDRGLISAGGGVFARDAKDIPLSSPVRKWLGVRHESMDGQGLVRLILKAEADLLWNGGIGTYVKAEAEKNEDAGDRSNDAVRVDAPQLKVKVIGEGGNLGLTQLGRIEYALGGGRINTDAVDNSGGVDCSDHEVNLKIFMQFLREKGKLVSGEERDRLLEEVTEDICREVLANNYGQSLCLSLDLKRCKEAIETFFELTERLSQAGLLDRKGEFLPREKEVLARSGGMLTRPELAILMAYSKMHLYQALLESELPDDDTSRTLLLGYFPEAMRERFRQDLPQHPLAREIAATVITNRVVDQAGSTFVNRLARRTGAAPAKIVESYLFFDRILGGHELRRQVFDQDNRMPSDRQQTLLLRLEEALAELCFWAVEHDTGSGEEFFGKVKEGVREFEKILGGVLPESEWNPSRQFAEALKEAGLSHEAAHTYAVLPFLKDFLPIQAVADDVDEDLYTVAQTYNEVRKSLDIRKILRLLDKVQERDHWDRLAHQTLKRDYAAVAFGLTRAVLRENKGNPEGFLAARRQKVVLYRRLADSLRGGVPVNYHPFTVMVRSLQSLLD